MCAREVQRTQLASVHVRTSSRCPLITTTPPQHAQNNHNPILSASPFPLDVFVFSLSRLCCDVLFHIIGSGQQVHWIWDIPAWYEARGIKVTERKFYNQLGIRMYECTIGTKQAPN